MDSEVVEVLKEIRDGVRGTNARLDQTNARLESLEGRVEQDEDAERPHPRCQRVRDVGLRAGADGALAEPHGERHVEDGDESVRREREREARLADSSQVAEGQDEDACKREVDPVGGQ